MESLQDKTMSKSLDEVIIAYDMCNNYRFCSHPEYGDCPYLDEDYTCDREKLMKNDVLYYLKEYQEYKRKNADS